ncbi:hypothetical protein [Brevibacillus reuszeri]|uniref:hypothetical protein n=1 Tax=Brevibacillus reuszeri TaxID=54915 RepID=UPI0013DFBF09|nr:hypothetical protein [Brevibacillus reuszeri]
MFQEVPNQVGCCDFCENQNVFIKEFEDPFGVHVMNGCFYGCGDKRNETEKG